MKNSSDLRVDVSGLSPEAVQRATEYPRFTTMMLNMYGEGLRQYVDAKTAALAKETDPFRQEQLQRSIDRYRSMHRARFKCEPEQREELRAVAEQALANEKSKEQ